jgi:hypothetical protein
MELSAQSKRGLNAIAARAPRGQGAIERTERAWSVVHARVRFAQTVVADAELGSGRDRALEHADGVRVATEREVALTEVSERQVRLRVVNVLRDLQQERDRLLRAAEVVEHRAERVEGLAKRRALLRVLCGLAAKNFDRATKRRLGLRVQPRAPVDLTDEQLRFTVIGVETDRSLELDER